MAWSCVEAGCDYRAYAPDEDTLVAAVMEHVRTAHDSFELEEMILAVIEPAPIGELPDDLVDVGPIKVPPEWAGAHAEGGLAEGKRSMEWSPQRGLADL